MKLKTLLILVLITLPGMFNSFKAQFVYSNKYNNFVMAAYNEEIFDRQYRDLESRIISYDLPEKPSDMIIKPHCFYGLHIFIITPFYRLHLAAVCDTAAEDRVLSTEKSFLLRFPPANRQSAKQEYSNIKTHWSGTLQESSDRYCGIPLQSH